MSSMTDHTAAGEVSPALAVDAMFAFRKTAALRAAIELDVITLIDAGANTARGIAARSGASERGLRVLCDYLTVLGFLTKGADVYKATPSSRMFLDRQSPAYVGGAIDFVASPEMADLFLRDPTGFVRNGGAEGLANISADNPIWVKFARAMGAFTGASARLLAADVAAWPKPPTKVLDIAAGPGLFGIEVAKAVPSARIVAVDWQAVLELSQQNAREAGIADRYSVKPGNAFEIDWGSGYDLILLPNFLHHFDMDTCVGLMKKVRASLTDDGRVLAVEFVPNDDRVSPPFEAAFAWEMLGGTPKGEAYTARELAEMGRRAGFSRARTTPMQPTPASMTLYER